MGGGIFKMATVAGLIGLVVLHAESFGKLVGAASKTFRDAVRLA